MAGRFFISKQYYPRERIEKKQTMKILRNIINNDNVLPFNLYYKEIKQGKKNSKSILYTRCRFSGRSKANFNKFKMSRMIFKKYGESGFLNGIKKASW
jgi:ribosomal protein S14